MRAMAERHKGLLPLDTVEGIWRIIIATFTYVQSNYSVHADTGSGDAAMRDSVRFHFGFTVPFHTYSGPAGVIAAVAASGGDLGVVRLDSGPSSGAWWRDLAGADAPKIIARLPFVERLALGVGEGRVLDGLGVDHQRAGGSQHRREARRHDRAS